MESDVTAKTSFVAVASLVSQDTCFRCFHVTVISRPALHTFEARYIEKQSALPRAEGRGGLREADVLVFLELSAPTLFRRY